MMQTFLPICTKILTQNLTTGPHFSSLVSHLGCINMPVLYTSPHPGGGCMALVLHCDTNQWRWRALLSCKHHSLLVLFKCLPSLSLTPSLNSQVCFTPTRPHPSYPPSPDFNSLSVSRSPLLKSK